MRLTKQGRLTLAVTEKLQARPGWEPDTQVTLEVEGDVLKVRPLNEPVSTGERAVRALQGKGNRRYATDEIMRMTRGEG